MAAHRLIPPLRRFRTLALGVLLGLAALGCEPGPRAGLAEARSSNDGLVATDVLPLLCTVRAVVDGDTLALICNGRQVRVRLHCIDAPEMEQGAWGRAARDHLAKMTPRSVAVLPQRTEHGNRDRFGRIVAEVLTPDAERRNLGMAQVTAGQAAVYPRYCTDQRYFWVEAVAKRSRVGIWRSPGLQQTPWTWRHRG